MTDRLLARSSASLCHTAVVLRTRTRIKALPRLSYKSRASDEAALRCHTGLGYFHQACSGAEENEERIKRALQHSWAIVYAHAREDQLHASSQQSTTSADSPEKDGQDSWEWVRERRRARSRRRKLVGLARLSSDHTLVAVLSDVVVLPELRSQGIGRTLLRRLVNVSVSRGITDIGVMAPPDCQGFFTKCGFGPDRQDLGSQAMAIVPGLWMTEPQSVASQNGSSSSEPPASSACSFDPNTDFLSSRIQSCLDASLHTHLFQGRRPGEVWYARSKHKAAIQAL
ncbi:hypothetical protein WJX74_001879 [Apatococcus lobatus]|uniref:N-acetyltransferase domain-containing protein n=1 Tax=Apatococcus lobatus TaxID=904363 RepID=A0AAW1QXP4_9CHLO